MKKLALIVISLLILSSCSSDESVNLESPSVPLDCAETKILSAFPEKIPNPKSILTDWEPAEGTDLYAAYNSGGIACSYGIQEAEIGATILWTPDYGTNYQLRIPAWVEAGQKEVDLPDFDEESAYVLTQGIEGEGEYHVWAINFLKDGFWIQVGATFFGSIEEAMPIVRAAADSILDTETAAAKSVVGCYFTDANDDFFVMDINYHDNTIVTANLAYLPFEKDSSKGTFSGTFENGILHGIYTFESEGVTSERELFFKRDKDGFIPGYGPVEVIDNKLERFQRPLQLTWDEVYRFGPGEDCATTIKGLS
jgi:hypothetical protein